MLTPSGVYFVLAVPDKKGIYAVFPTRFVVDFF